MSTTIKAIETIYPWPNGPRYRSRLEARWAVFLDTLGIPYEYEKEGFDLNGIWYLPDFWLPAQETWIEIKPTDLRLPKPQSFYLAGKIQDSDWRDDILEGSYTTINGHHFIGPSQMRKAHDRDEHGVCAPRDEILRACFDAIRQCDVVFAWIDHVDTYGTFVEIGYAHALGKEIWVAFDERLRDRIQRDPEYFSDHDEWQTSSDHDMWFIQMCASRSCFTSSPDVAFREWSPRAKDEANTKCELLAQASGQPVWLVRGDPWDGAYDVTTLRRRSPTALQRETGLAFGIHKINGTLTLFPSPHGLWVLDKEGHLERAYIAARQARFEHGERGR